jgi:hypothetical protein
MFAPWNPYNTHQSIERGSSSQSYRALKALLFLYCFHGANTLTVIEHVFHFVPIVPHYTHNANSGDLMISASDDFTPGVGGVLLCTNSVTRVNGVCVVGPVGAVYV